MLPIFSTDGNNWNAYVRGWRIDIIITVICGSRRLHLRALASLTLFVRVSNSSSKSYLYYFFVCVRLI